MKQVNKEGFEYYNPNSHKCGDCVVRAIVKVTEKSWYQVFDELCAIARKMQYMPNDMETMKKYLTQQGFRWVSVKPARGERRKTIADFVQMSKENPKARYVVRVSHHVAPVMDGKLYDLSDCSWCAVYGYFVRDGI